MRQQLLAHAMERSGELDADTVRVLHVAPATNTELQLSLTRDSHRAAGATLYAAWRAMLRRPDSESGTEHEPPDGRHWAFRR